MNISSLRNAQAGVSGSGPIKPDDPGNDARHRLAAIVESSDDAIISKDLNGIIVTWNKGAERLFGYTSAETVGKHVTMLIPVERHDEEPGIISRIRSGERIEHYETVRRRKDGSYVDISLTVSPIRGDKGEVIGASKIARDISERKQAQAQRDLLVAELSHRVKNTLATVISIARQSFANPNTEEARHAFDSRIRALAQTHGRLAECNWSGVNLETLFADELSPYRHHHGTNLRISGPKLSLNPRSALTLGMAIHELVTNAAKHGAISAEKGRISVDWTVDAADGTLRLSWVESDSPGVEPPVRSGFGRLLLERALASDLKSKVTLTFAPQGFTCTIAIPQIEYAASF